MLLTYNNLKRSVTHTRRYQSSIDDELMAHMAITAGTERCPRDTVIAGISKSAGLHNTWLPSVSHFAAVYRPCQHAQEYGGGGEEGPRKEALLRVLVLI